MALVYPQEIIVWHVLPAVKARMARKLKDEGISQGKIANMLLLTESTVSQYLSGKRAHSFKIPADVEPLIDVVLETIKEENNPEVMIFGVSQVCNEIVQKGHICETCKGLSKRDDDCRACFPEEETLDVEEDE